MITKYKIYEEINFQEPKVGDYVYIKSPNIDSSTKQFPWLMSDAIEIRNFIDNNIGTITYVGKTTINVLYKNIPNKFKKPGSDYFRFDDKSNNGWTDFNKKFINVFGKSKEELETKLLAKKYNL